MLPLLERFGLRKKSAQRFAPTPEVLNQLELLVHSGELGDKDSRTLLCEMTRTHDYATVLSTISRIHCAGLREERFLTFAVDYCTSLRDLDAAFRYAVSLRHDAQQSGDAAFRLGKLAYLRGVYGTAISSLTDHLSRSPQSGEARWYLGLSHLRHGSFRQALECLSSGGRIKTKDAQWLSSVVENGLGRGPKDWFGRRNSRLQHELTRGWRETVLNAPLSAKTTSLADVDIWINRCSYVSDQRLFGTSEYWQTPDEMEANRLGDCEDFALWAWVQLLRQGVDARLVMGGLFSDEANHVWVHIHRQRSVLVFECTPMGINLAVDSKCAHEYQPIVSVDRSLATMVHVADWEQAFWA